MRLFLEHMPPKLRREVAEMYASSDEEEEEEEEEGEGSDEERSSAGALGHRPSPAWPGLRCFAATGLL